MCGGHLGEVEDDRRPELHVGAQRAVGVARRQLLDGGLLQRVGDLVAVRAELLGRAAQHAGARVLGAVDAVPEAHEALLAVEQALDVADRVAALLDLVEHGQHARRRTAVQRAGQRADRAGDRGGGVGAGGGDDARGEGRGVHAVLGGRHEVGVDGLGVRRVGLALPADHEALDDRLGLVDLALRHHRLAEAARRLRHEGHRHDRDARQVVADLVDVDVEHLLQAPGRREHRDRGLHVDADVTGVHRQRERLGRRQAGVELPVDQQAPDVAEADVADELLDVDAAVAEGAALLVRLGDLRLEGDDALEAGLEQRLVGHVAAPQLRGVYLVSVPILPCRPPGPRTTPRPGGPYRG